MNETKTTKIYVDNVGQQNARDFWQQFDNMQEKNNNLQSKIDKVNEIIKDWHQEYNGLMETNNIYIPKDKPSLFDLRDILKEDK